jgi:hypothetical protein
MKPYPPPQWQTLSATAHKTDLGGKLPEVVILLLSDKIFQKFSKSPEAAKRFIDNLHILKQPLIKLKFADRTPDRETPGGDWIVIVPHTTKSTAIVVAWQLPGSAPDQPPPPTSQSDLRKPPSKRKKRK